jgi:hypothetical protein
LFLSSQAYCGKIFPEYWGIFIEGYHGEYFYRIVQKPFNLNPDRYTDMGQRKYELYMGFEWHQCLEDYIFLKIVVHSKDTSGIYAQVAPISKITFLLGEKPDEIVAKNLSDSEKEISEMSEILINRRDEIQIIAIVNAQEFIQIMHDSRMVKLRVDMENGEFVQSDFVSPNSVANKVGMYFLKKCVEYSQKPRLKKSAYRKQPYVPQDYDQHGAWKSDDEEE